MISRGFFLVMVSLISLAQSKARMQVGTPASILNDLRAENVGKSSVYAFPTFTADPIQVRVEDYYFEGGRLSMSGTALESRNSRFILKGNEDGLYGWVVLKDKNVAFEYTTDENGNVLVGEVAVTDIYPVCNMHGPGNEAGADHAGMNVMPPADTLTPHVGEYPGSDVNKLQGLPGATKVIYIDITRIQSKPKAEVWKAWQAVSASYSSFQVNVTTDPAVYQKAGTANSGKSTVYNQSGRSSCCLGCFGTASSCTIYLDGAGDGYSMGRTISHEVGHQMGLAHDGGNPGGEYYAGIPAFQWTPMMGDYWPGNYWAEALYQWSKGEYTSANNKQDDWAVIARNAPYKNDDIPGTVPLKMQEGKVSALLNRGQIGRNTDEDVFAFKVTGSGGRAKLKINRIEYIGGAMLDVEARILDAGGKEVAKDNKVKARYAEFDTPLGAGDYTLVVKGGAEGTPANGFSNYGSVGYYAIEGEITGGVTGVTGPEKAAEAAAVRVSPVSADGFLKLAYPENGKVEKIAMFSISGTVVYQSKTRVNSIDVGSLPVGLYVLKVAMEGNTVVKRIVRR